MYEWGTHKGASLNDVRTEEAGGPRKAPNLRTNSKDFADREGKGVKIFKKCGDVTDGSPLT